MTLSLLVSQVVIHLWQSTLCALVAAVVVALLRGREARIRHAVWLGASLKFLVPFSVLLALGASMGSMWPPVGPMPEPVREVLEQASRVPAPLARQAGGAASAAAFSVLPFLLVGWAAGALVIVVRWTAEWRQVRRYLIGASLLRMVEGLPVLSSPLMRDEQCEPGLFGVLRPVVLVPDGIAERLTPREFDAVLVHELWHARRRDNLVALAHALVEAAFWFHPVVWWLGRRLRDERERACDEAVIHAGVDLDVYAQAILTTCRFYTESRFAAVAGISGAGLRRRLEDIVMKQVGRQTPPLLRATLTAAAAVAVVAPLTMGMLTTTLRAQSGNSFVGLQTSMERKFDVASIKVNRSADRDWLLGAPRQGSETIRNLELRKIVASSFRIQDKMVFGPEWMDTIRYDIQARGANTANNPEVWEMMRSLLAERFKLRYHLETREIPAYVVVTRGGHKLVKGEDGQCAEAVKSGLATCDAIQYFPYGVGIRDMPIAALTSALARSLQDRPVVERTGLAGRYDARILWRPDGMTAEQLADIPADVRPPDVNLFEAFEQQTGLRLEARREPIEVIVVDHIERAEEN